MSKKKQPEILDYYPTDDDGYTLDAYISALPKVHNAVRISFRPTYVTDRALLVEANRKLDEKKFAVHLSDWAAKHLVSWSIQEKVGGQLVPMPITTENILKLKPQLWSRLTTIVCWGDGGDQDPEATEDTTERTDSTVDQLQKN